MTSPAPAPARSRMRHLATLSPRAAIVWAGLVATMFLLLGATATPERQLRLARDTLHDRSASGRIVIVEIDARSLAAIGRWPWPRQHHARLVDQLVRAGSTTVAFDVDFSTASEPAGDAALARAIRAADGRVVLPTFRQAGSLAGNAQVENLPLAMFREGAMLASVNVRPERDGQLVTYSGGTITGGLVRPSLAAMLAGGAGTTGDAFRIDTAIAPQTIPRISALDILQGRFAAGAVAGKAVLVGGTAIEMGDRYALPNHGIQPGVIAQALAAETLIAGTGARGWGSLPAFVACLAALMLLPARRVRDLIVSRALLACSLMAAPLLFEALLLTTIGIVPAILLLGLETTLRVAALSAAHLQRQRSLDRATGLPNVATLEDWLADQPAAVVVVVRLGWFEQIDAVLSDETRGTLTGKVVDRLAIAFPGSQCHAVGPGVLAFSDPDREATTIVARIESAAALFRAPIQLDERLVLVTPAFGICPGTGAAGHVLIAQASLAATEAQSTRRIWAIHSDSAQSEAQQALTLLGDLDGAIERGDIFVVYQPKFATAYGRVTGAEGLVRWKHPTLGPIAPDSFIPLLEASGNIARLTLAVLDQALGALTAWQRVDPRFGVAVNISAALLTDTSFVAQAHRRLDASRHAARTLTFEITESAALEQARVGQQVLEAFRARGVRIAIDDYGTGRATLSYLRAFPVDEVKVDKSFVTNMLDDVGNQVLLRSTIALGQELGFEIVAEGVETQACIEALIGYGCTYLQGYGIGRPMTADAIESAFLDNRQVA